MKTIIDMLIEQFDATTQEQRDKFAERTPEWLTRIRQDVYIDRSGRVAYRSGSEPRRRVA